MSTIDPPSATGANDPSPRLAAGRLGAAVSPKATIDAAATRPSPAAPIRPRPSRRKPVLLKAAGLHLTLTTVGLLLFLPFLWMVLTSLKDLSQVGLRSWIPQATALADTGQYGPQRLADLRAALASPQDPAERWLSAQWDSGDIAGLNAEDAAAFVNRLIRFATEPIEAPAIADAPADARLDRALAELDALPLGPDNTEARRQLAQETRARQLHAALPDLVPAPAALRWHNYLEVFRQIPFVRYYANSLFIASCVTFLQVFTSSLAAFSFARLRWPGRDRVFLLYLSTMMLPGLVMMIPNYQVMITLGLVDTMLGLILPGAFTAFGTFLLRQFMLSIPHALDEAAEIDGASKWRLYWDVILPLTRPGLVTLAIFTFMGNYNSFFWPLVMLKSEHKYTLPIGLLAFDSSAGQQTNLLMAAIAMAIVPMIIVFVVMQKQLVKGIQLGAVKG
ncbi:MAG: carbohydrate ABC transporter permease [Planctomycetota bacterium]